MWEQKLVRQSQVYKRGTKVKKSANKCKFQQLDQKINYCIFEIPEKKVKFGFSE
jgi:hypothetical protein